MIPIDKIIPANLYSQDNAQFLLGNGFSKAAAKEAICEACRSGQLESKRWRRRYWFTGHEFLAWVARWFGSEFTVDIDADEEAPLARVLPLGQDEPTKQKPVAVRRGGR